MTRTARIDAVVLNWRTAEMTLKAVAALDRALAGRDARILVVDNDSGDGSEETLRAAAARRGPGAVPLEVMASGRNGGYGFGNNLALRRSLATSPRPDYIWVLNSDAFPEPGALAPLLERLEAHPRAAVAGSLLMDWDGTPQLSTFRFPSVPGEFEGGARFRPVAALLARWSVPRFDTPSGAAVDWLAGASILMRSAALAEVGLFDEGYFLYFEETDLCHRLNAAGWRVHYVPESRVVHQGSVSTGMRDWTRVPDYWFDSRWRYFTARGGTGLAVAATLARLAGGAVHAAKCALKRESRGDPPGFHRQLLRHALSRLAARRPGIALTGPVEGSRR